MPRPATSAANPVASVVRPGAPVGPHTATTVPRRVGVAAGTGSPSPGGIAIDVDGSPNDRERVVAALAGTTPPLRTASVTTEATTDASASSGTTCTMQYVGHSWSTGKQFDASWDRGQPFSFQLGAGMVIGGWDQGVAGMKVGGRRRLTIPPELGYGARGAGRDIKGGETLVFVVDLLGVR